MTDFIFDNGHITTTTPSTATNARQHHEPGGTVNHPLSRWLRNDWAEITVPLENYIGERVAVVHYSGSGETAHYTGTVERSYDSRTGEPGVSVVSRFPRDISSGEVSSTDMHAILTKREARDAS